MGPLIKRNLPQSNVTGPNKSYVVTVTVFGNLYEEKKYHSYVEKRPFSCLSYQQSLKLFGTFLPEKPYHRQKTLTHRVFVMKTNHCNAQPSGLRLQ